MKISKSKQELARIISENGGWRDWAGWSVFGKKSMAVVFVDESNKKPIYDVIGKAWPIIRNSIVGEFSCSPFPNWHQTILSRAEYFHLYPAPDADGWIEWNGGECPVDEGALIDVRYRDGHEQIGCECGIWGGELYGTCCWLNSGGKSNIVAYRLNKPEQANAEFCKSVTRAIPEPEAKPTIEQLAADYRNAKDLSDSKQQEADAAKADAEEKLKALELAGEALGLIVSPITAKQEPELVITDWRDLRVGDEVECVKVNKTGDNYADEYIGKIGVAIKTEPPMLANQAVKLRFCDGKEYWISEWRFIRRP